MKDCPECGSEIDDDDDMRGYLGSCAPHHAFRRELKWKRALAAAFNLKVIDRTKITTITRAITVMRAELVAHARWPDHDPGDEDDSGWLISPLAPRPAKPTMYDELLERSMRQFRTGSDDRK